MKQAVEMRVRRPDTKGRRAEVLRGSAGFQTRGLHAYVTELTPSRTKGGVWRAVSAAHAHCGGRAQFA